MYAFGLCSNCGKIWKLKTSKDNLPYLLCTCGSHIEWKHVTSK